jgi:Tol biopolymer transport system component
MANRRFELQIRARPIATADGMATWRLRSALASIFGVVLLLVLSACGSPSSNILFTTDRDGNLEIYSVSTRGEGETNLTNSQVDEFAPRLSPNRRFVSFLTGDEDATALEVMRIDGTERAAMTQMGAARSSQRWSPNNDRIAFAESRATSTSIYVATIAGATVALLTSVAGDEVGGWSRDGDNIAFAVREGPEQGIYRRNPDGVNEFRVTNNPDYSPVWSPDSSKLAFLSERDGNPELYVMDADASNVKRLTETDAAEYDISWSPNGQSILFVSERDDNPEIYVTAKDGTRQERLTFNTTVDNQPVWSPTGKQIAFVSYLDGDADIFVMNADGKNQGRVTNNDFEDTQPTW